MTYGLLSLIHLLHCSDFYSDPLILLNHRSSDSPSTLNSSKTLEFEHYK